MEGATVSPNETNHIKLAIADAGDWVYDSWVLIRVESFVSIPELYLEPPTAADKAGIEHKLTATATLDSAPQQGVTVDFMVINSYVGRDYRQPKSPLLKWGCLKWHPHFLLLLLNNIINSLSIS